MPWINVHIDLGEIGSDELISEMRRRGHAISDKAGSELDHVVERAFDAVRNMESVPNELKDLFYQVHNLAMP